MSQHFIVQMSDVLVSSLLGTCSRLVFHVFHNVKLLL